MIKVLDLFAGTQSVKKALEEKYGIEKWYQSNKNDFLWIGWDYYSNQFIEYIGVDIYSPEGQNLIFDLTQDNIVEKLLNAPLMSI